MSDFFIPNKKVLEMLMCHALEKAQEAFECGEVPIGAVVGTVDGEVLSAAHNEVETYSCAVKHAEILAIERASKKLGRWRLLDEILCVTVEPCTMCAGAIINARMPLLVFGAREPRTGACGSQYNVLQSEISKETHVVEGLLSAESEQLIRTFFQSRRSEP